MIWCDLSRLKPRAGSFSAHVCLFPALVLLLLVHVGNSAPLAGTQDGDVCFQHGGRGEQDERGCFENTATYYRYVDGICTAVSTDCHDLRRGSSGDDVLHGYLGNDRLWGKAGDDLLYGGRGKDLLIGGEDDDVLQGGRGDDILQGRSGDDVLKGGRGDDTLVGGPGDDVLQGGRGADDFEYIGYPLRHNGSDEITDFEPGKDVIVLYGRTINGEFIGYTGFDALSLTLDRVGEARNDTILDLSAHGGGQVRLEGIDPADLSADDFWFMR